jgi:hypothetical protein
LRVFLSQAQRWSAGQNPFPQQDKHGHGYKKAARCGVHGPFGKWIFRVRKRTVHHEAHVGEYESKQQKENLGFGFITMPQQVGDGQGRSEPGRSRL